MRRIVERRGQVGRIVGDRERQLDQGVIVGAVCAAESACLRGLRRRTRFGNGAVTARTTPTTWMIFSFAVDTPPLTVHCRSSLRISVTPAVVAVWSYASRYCLIAPTENCSGLIAMAEIRQLYLTVAS